MAEWRNLDTLNAFRALQESDHRADLKTVLSGAAGAERVKKYSVPMAGGLAFNFAAKQVDDEILASLVKEAERGRLEVRALQSAAEELRLRGAYIFAVGLPVTCSHFFKCRISHS